MIEFSNSIFKAKSLQSNKYSNSTFVNCIKPSTPPVTHTTANKIILPVSPSNHKGTLIIDEYTAIIPQSLRACDVSATLVIHIGRRMSYTISYARMYSEYVSGNCTWK